MLPLARIRGLQSDSTGTFNSMLAVSAEGFIMQFHLQSFAQLLDSTMGRNKQTAICWDFQP